VSWRRPAEALAPAEFRDPHPSIWSGVPMLTASMWPRGKVWRIRKDHFDQAMEARRVSALSAPAGGLWDPDSTDKG
jgi:hypothetical protein